MALMLMSLMAPVETVNAAIPSVAEAGNTKSGKSDNLLILLSSKPTNTGAGSGIGGSRKAKARVSYSSVEARIRNGVLIFNNEFDLYDVEVRIEDEYDDIVMSSFIDILADEDNAIDISSLPVGYYTLYVTINGAEYYATFEM